MESKCIECKDRHIGCHSTCDYYLSWRKELDGVKTLIRKAKKKQSDFFYHK